MRGWWLFLWLFLGLASARAETLEFVTDPPGARVFVNQSIVGLSGERLRVDLGDQPVVTISLQLEGYQPQTFQVDRSALTVTRRYPTSGSVQLEPLHWWVPLQAFARANPVALVVLILFGLSLILRLVSLYGRVRRAEARLALREGRQSLGRWVLDEKIGQGGMACVYRGIDLENPDARPVAIKIPHRDLLQQEELRQRFLREIQVVSRLAHPNIVRMIDFGVTPDKTPFMVCDLVEGQTLRELIRPGGMPFAQALPLMREILSTMAWAHEQQVIHRNLKPDNIMVRPSGRIVLLDFGLARPIESSHQLTVQAAVMGTPGYMAPEQIRGEQATRQMDQYALGATFYELLTGRKPFQAEEPLGRLFQHLSADPEPPANCSKTVAAWLLKMLAREPADRFASLEECLAVLSREGPPPPGPRS